ncbi:medium-chain acyl-CoA ligase ACSF2, mitochondrial isoform X2 [Venturia canescens]|uniref:medium-chain acyl-CoA ligase ACSF2, mitochondrial isoform X2 n=1 Tax=Venturia canescens TaxID=32260 RepID=UPI001C9CE5EC|nr:medium-chain acyl-CoA ligase ACSF2, mitochondrial isoform X2 [Venturia canescens]
MLLSNQNQQNLHSYTPHDCSDVRGPCTIIFSVEFVFAATNSSVFSLQKLSIEMLGSSRRCGLWSQHVFRKLNYHESSRGLSVWSQRGLSNLGVLSAVNECRNRGVTKRWSSSETPKIPSYFHHKVETRFLEWTTGKLLESAAEQWPNRECFVSSHQGVRMTYTEVLRRVDKLAAGLVKLGLKRGDRIAVWGPNDVEWFISFMAIARAGLIMVGVNPAYVQNEINYCLKKVDARAVISPRSFKTQNYAEMLIKAKESCPNLEHIVIYSEDHAVGTRRFVDVESLANNGEVQAIAATQDEISPHDGCNIQFTSGTTGNPKATLLCHRAFVNNSKQGAARLGLMNEHNKICLNVPFFHAFGMAMGQFCALQSGATIVLESASFNPKNSIETIMREKCSVCYGTPTMWIHLLDARERLQAPVDTLRYGVTGGSIISASLVRRIREELGCSGLGHIYGLTETTAIAFQSLPNESPELTENTVGHLSDHLEAMVVDDTGSPVPMGSMGELWLRGYSMMMKYWDDDVSTKKVLTDDGWLKTGDQFVLRPDGYGRIVGRYKDMIIRGGENIFPKEIEHYLESHPDVQEAHTFAVHDDIYGDEICACVRLKENSKLTKNELRAYGKGRVAHFKIPRYIEFVDDFPRTTSGKIQKFKIKEELEKRGVVPTRPMTS